VSVSGNRQRLLVQAVRQVDGGTHSPILAIVAS
jgi:hypothetical protein